MGSSTGTVGGANDDSLSASPHDAGPRHTAKRLEDLPTVLERIIKAQQNWKQCSVKQAGDHHTLPDARSVEQDVCDFDSDEENANWLYSHVTPYDQLL